MKIEIDVNDVVRQVEDELRENIREIVRRETDRIVREEIHRSLFAQLDALDNTPYDIIGQRVAKMLCDYVEREIERRK